MVNPQAMAIRYKADYRSIAFVIFWYALLAVAFYLPFQWYYAVPSMIGLCLFAFFITVIVHNTVHVPVFDKKWQNRIFQVFLTFAHGHPVSGFVPGHNLSHHKHLDTPKDAARSSRARFKINFFNQFLFFFLVARDVAAAEKAFVNKMKTANPKWVRQYYTEFAILMSIKLGLTLVFPLKAICFLWIPHLYAVWGIFGTNFWQHDGCDKDHPYNHSRNFTSPWFNFWVFNNGYHGAHHLKPNLHWSLYPEYHQKHVLPQLHPNLNRNTLFAYVWEACIYPGKRLDYLGNPVVLPPKVPTGDWVNDVKPWESSSDMGAVDMEVAPGKKSGRLTELSA